MPYTSKAQLRTCYSKKLSAEAKGKKSNWDCDEFLEATPNPTCLPERKGSPKKECRPLRKEEKIVSPVYIGAKGGLYFYAGGVKIYVPKDAHDYVMKKYKPQREQIV